MTFIVLYNKTISNHSHDIAETVFYRHIYILYLYEARLHVVRCVIFETALLAKMRKISFWTSKINLVELLVSYTD